MSRWLKADFLEDAPSITECLETIKDLEKMKIRSVNNLPELQIDISHFVSRSECDASSDDLPQTIEVDTV